MDRNNACFHMEVTPCLDVQAADILAKEGISAEVNKYLKNSEFPCFLVHFFFSFVPK